MQNENITLETLPKAAANILIEIGQIKKLLLESINVQNNRHEQELYTTVEVCAFLKISKSSLAKLRASGLPCIRIDSNIRFDIEAVLSFIKSKQANERAP